MLKTRGGYVVLNFGILSQRFGKNHVENKPRRRGYTTPAPAFSFGGRTVPRAVGLIGKIAKRSVKILSRGGGWRKPPPKRVLTRLEGSANISPQVAEAICPLLDASRWVSLSFFR